MIRIKTKTQIMWIIVTLYMLKTYLLSAEMFFMLCIAVIGMYIIRKRAIAIPKIPGLIFYTLVLILITLIGITKYPVSLIERDVFYEFFSIVYLVLGYYSYDYYRGRDKSLFKTVCLILFVTSIICVVQGVASVGSGAGFAEFRDSFSQSVGAISFLVPVLIGRRYIYKENTFSFFRDNFLIVLWLLQLLLNLSRISIINMAIGIVIFIGCGIYKKKLNVVGLFRITIGIVVIVIFASTFINIMPDEAKERFEEKFSNSLTEISAENEYSDLSDAQSDWRGYEIQCAQEQWLESDLLTQLIGGGNGTLIYIHYIPDQWKGTVEIQNSRFGVTILHNTYYTLLVKGGLLAIIALFYFFFANINTGFRALTKYKDDRVLYGSILIIFCVLIIVDAYVIRSMMDKGAEMLALLLIGWINARLVDNERSIEHKDEAL